MKRFRAFAGNAAVLLAAALATASARAQIRRPLPEIGHPAPPLHLAQVLEGPPPGRVTWAALKGNVVVVEFWATWCPPCVASIPQLNALADEFAGQPVRFLSITDEGAGVVGKFLAEHPIRGWVALDENRETLEGYGVRFIPLTVIIGRDGRIAALTRPEALNETVLREFLAGEKPMLTPPAGSADVMIPGSEPAEFVPRAEPLFYIDVRPDTNPVGSLAIDRDGGRVTAVAWPAKVLLSVLLQIPEDRILGTSLLPAGRYSVVADMPAGSDAEFQAHIERALEMAWGVQLRHERRKVDVYLLTAPHGAPPALRPPSVRAAGQTSSRGSQAKGQPLSRLARMLEDRLDRPVIDRTRLGGDYEFDLRLPGGDPAGVVAAVRRFGLDLKPARRKLDVVVVEKGSGNRGRAGKMH